MFSLPSNLLMSLQSPPCCRHRRLPARWNLIGCPPSRDLWVSGCQCSRCGVPVVSPAAFLYWLEKGKKNKNKKKGLLQCYSDIATLYV